MTDLPPSPLPRDPAYWDALAERVRNDAALPLAAYRAPEQEWYGWLSLRAPWLVAASAVAALALWLALPARSARDAAQWIEGSLTPNEAVGSLLGGAAPPSVEAMLAHFPPALEREGER